MQEIWENIKKNKPLIHSITNYVTANDVANVILALGGSPIMADDLLEVEEIQKQSSGLNLNLGTPNDNKTKAMMLAGKVANKLHHPMVLDLVGIGASKYRQEIVSKILKEIKITVIKGNISEIKTLVLAKKSSFGIDALAIDQLTIKDLDTIIPVFQHFAKNMQTILMVTGEIDLVLDANRCYVIKNGNPKMASFTGSGCQLAGVLCTLLASNPQDFFQASALASMLYGIAGEIATQSLKAGEGNVTYKNKIIDVISLLDYQMIEKRMKYEIR